MTNLAVLAAARTSGSSNLRTGRAPNFHAHLLDYIDKTRGNALYPHRRAQVVAQVSGDTSKLQLSGVGEGGTSDLMSYPVLQPYITTQMLDSYGQAIPGAPQAGDDVLVRETRPGNPIVYGQPSPGASQLPFLTDITAGNGVTTDTYGTYAVGGITPGSPDAVVKKPRVRVVAGNGIAVNTSGVNVLPKTSAPSGQAGGLQADSGGLGISLGTASGLSVGSGLAVTAGNGITVNGSGVHVLPKTSAPAGQAGGLQADAGGLGISLSSTSGLTTGSGLAVNPGNGITTSGGSVAVNAGSGISTGSGSVAVKTGSGIGIDGSGNVYNTSPNVSPTAGSGISVSGSTVSVNASTGLSFSGGALVVALADGNGCHYSGGTISARLGTGLGFDGFGNIALALSAGNGISVSGATVSAQTYSGSAINVGGAGISVNTDGTTIGISGNLLGVITSNAFSWGGTHTHNGLSQFNATATFSAYPVFGNGTYAFSYTGPTTGSQSGATGSFPVLMSGTLRYINFF